MLPENGHLNPSFKLMRTLQQRGHEVRYLAPRALAGTLEAQGFPVEPFFPELEAPEPVAPAPRTKILISRVFRGRNFRD